jgi:hypothetical protein
VNNYSSHRRVFVWTSGDKMRVGHQPLEMTAVKKFNSWGLSAAVATVAFGLFAVTAQAQTPPPAAAPVVKTPAAAAKPAATAPAKKAATPAASVCKGLDETGCKANAECGWTVPTKANAKTGKVQAPYCHKMAGVAVKKPAAAATAPKAPAAAAPKVPAAAAPAAPKAPAAAPAAPATK